ncbi:hypothetical protein GUITHDRAFT_109995 [Guillardia theta CCMP2712]|uniref:Uncharacterized protein n=1 Tax=Guillardia theta (strain CCMP2712) TaxID=905079 RepID=L1J6P0_GUITC|nr:hypothetical protein GUITHDRAFT_109995 [Guillardia theta CCMP2712]EKX44208.1 hypothetical protein GUITHDRAFT_109995 [Guillardia theta CCMP2712]|eukprot:XP_005831188.1 hypothetical protein GUITHDRAFT_109995 [Guillardia theta CCMP2712]
MFAILAKSSKPVYNDITPTVSKNWSGPIEMPQYTKALIEAYSCVGGDVGCNAAPANPTAADTWSGTRNNP